MLGERWTLLILRELIGGARRYGDLRAALPGIATNLLADRRRELEEAGLVARTVYSLNTAGWHKVPPVVKAVATFGLDLIEPTESAITPLNGFLAGMLLAFDPPTDSGGTYHIDIDGRRFEFAVQAGELTAATDPPAVTVSASAADLIAARLGASAQERKAALRRLTFHGNRAAVTAMRRTFRLDGDPSLRMGQQ